MQRERLNPKTSREDVIVRSGRRKSLRHAEMTCPSARRVTISPDNPTEISRSDVDEVVRTLLNNDAYTILDNIEGEDKFGTAPRMNGRYKSSLIDLEAVA